MTLGSFTVTRDGMLLWLLAGAALVGYLVSADKPPTDWNYHEWLHFAVAGFAWGIGKLQVSPSPSGNEVRRGVREDGRPVDGTTPV